MIVIPSQIDRKYLNLKQGSKMWHFYTRLKK